MSTTPDYSLTRQDVAHWLGVSVRTVDRHIRRNLFDTKRIGRNIWISQLSFKNYYEETFGKPIPTESNDLEEPSTPATTPSDETAPSSLSQTPSPHLVTISESDPQEMPPESSPHAVSGQVSFSPSQSASFTSHERHYNLTPAHIYKTLYEELKDKHDDQIKRLEGAHYRVGQLEAQVNSMVPLVEFKKQQKQLLLMDKQYKESIDEANRKLSHSKTLVKGERLNKNVYISLVYALLAFHVVFWVLLQR